jgi:hypothetical protein
MARRTRCITVSETLFVHGFTHVVCSTQRSFRGSVIVLAAIWNDGISREENEMV